MDIATIADSLLQRLLFLAPKVGFVLAGALATIVIGNLASRAAGWLVGKSRIDDLADSAGASKVLREIGLRQGVSGLVAQVVRVVVWLVGAGAIADALGLPALATLTTLAIQFLPRILTAGAILIGGVLGASFVRGLLRKIVSSRSDIESPDVGPRLSYYLMLVVTVVLAADQAGIRTGIIESIILIVVGGGAAGLALAAALGMKSAFSSIIARLYLQRSVAPGEQIFLGDIRGVVVRYTPVAVVLRTEHGESIVPCGRFWEQSVVLLEAHGVSSDEDSGP